MKRIKKSLMIFCIAILVCSMIFPSLVFAGAKKPVSGENTLCKWTQMPMNHDVKEGDAHYQLSLLGNSGDGLTSFINTNTDKKGYYDLKGNIVIAAKYDEVGQFKNGYAWVNLNGKEGLIDKKGKIIFPINYDAVGSYCEGLISVKKNGKVSYLNINGKTMFSVKADKSYDFSNGLAAFITGKKYGFINKKGSVAIKATYDRAYDFCNGYAAVKKDGKWGFINTKGTYVIKPRVADGVLAYGNGLFGFYTYDKTKYNGWGGNLLKVEYVDIKGKTKIKLNDVYQCYSFSNGYTALTKYNQDFNEKGRYVYGFFSYFIDTNGKVVPIFDFTTKKNKNYFAGTISGYSNGIATVSEFLSLDERQGYIIQTKTPKKK